MSPQGPWCASLPRLGPPTAHPWAQPWGPCGNASLASHVPSASATRTLLHCSLEGGTCPHARPAGPRLLPSSPAVLTQPHGWCLTQPLALRRGSVSTGQCPFPASPAQPRASAQSLQLGGRMPFLGSTPTLQAGLGPTGSLLDRTPVPNQPALHSSPANWSHTGWYPGVLGAPKLRAPGNGCQVGARELFRDTGHQPEQGAGCEGLTCRPPCPAGHLAC